MITGTNKSNTLRILAMLLAMLMVFSLLPVTTLAAGEGDGDPAIVTDGDGADPEDPSVTDPPVTDPPVTETDPPVTDPPVTDPPVTDPPVTETDPPVTDPPVTDPPVTDPPVTDPPVTDPPEPVDDTAPVIVLDPASGTYAADFTVKVSVTDEAAEGEAASGVDSATYKIGAAEAQPLELDEDGNGEISVQAEGNYGKKVVVTVAAKDKAGNESDSVKAEFTIQAPTVTIKFEKDTPLKEKTEYYASRTPATITISNLGDSDTDAVVAAVKSALGYADGAISAITAKDSEGNDVDNAYSVSFSDGKITFDKDANYTIDLDALSKLSSVNVVVQGSDGKPLTGETYQFTIDNEAPEPNITTGLEKKNYKWVLTIQVAPYDATSGIDMSAASNNAVWIYAGNKKLEDVKDNEWKKADRDTITFDDSVFTYTESHTYQSSFSSYYYIRVIDKAGLITYYDVKTVNVELDPAEESSTGNIEVTVKVQLPVGYPEIKIANDKTFYTIKDKSSGTTVVRKAFQASDFHGSDGYYEATIPIELPDGQAFGEYELEVTVYSKNGGKEGPHAKVTGSYTINPAPPEVSFAYGTELPERGTFYKTRTATVTFTDATFNEEDQANAATAIGSVINCYSSGTYSIEWVKNNEAKITFGDGVYTVNAGAISFTNRCGLQNDGVIDASITEGDPQKLDPTDPAEFTVDHTPPTGSISVLMQGWEKPIENLTFGLWSNTSQKVIGVANDATSPILSVDYYIYTGDTALTLKDGVPQGIDDESWTSLTAADWSGFNVVSLSPNRQATVYLRIRDAANNTAYVSTNGFILDNKMPTIDNDDPGTAYYTADVNLNVTVTDPQMGIAKVFSGLKYVWYEVKSLGKTTQGSSELDKETNKYKSTLYKFDVTNPTKQQLVQTKSFTIKVDSKLNNSDDVVVTVYAEDNAGNVYSKDIPLKITTTVPTLTISYDNNGVIDTLGGRGYFDAPRTAKIVIVDRYNAFNEITANDMIVAAISSDKGSYEFVIIDEETGEKWERDTSAMNENGDGAIFTATVKFTDDANYTIDSSKLVYENGAGLKNSGVNIPSGTESPYVFTVDTVDPTGTVSIPDAPDTWAKKLWDTLIEILSFGRWSNKKVTVKGTSEDATSPVKSVDYYVTASKTALEENDEKLYEGGKEVTNWTSVAAADLSSFEVKILDPDQQATVYLRIRDYAGNTKYISTNGFILDEHEPELTVEVTTTESTKSHTSLPTGKPKGDVGYYNCDVDVSISVTDPLIGGTFSGLKYVWYEVKSLGVTTQGSSEVDVSTNGYSSTLYKFDISDPARDQLQQSWDGSITVDSALNNSDDVVVTIYAEDNAGNPISKQIHLKIDITDPTMTISYEDNGLIHALDGRGYFDAPRTATIVITDRNTAFDEELATNMIEAAISSDKGAYEFVTDQNTGKKWAPGTPKSSNGDGTTFTATLKFKDDANYTIDESKLSYTNYADLTTGMSVASGDYPYIFTVDTLDPTGTISTPDAPDKTWAQKTWDKLIELLTFGRWSSESQRVVGTSSDETSPIYSVDYYYTASTSPLKEENKKLYESGQEVTNWTNLDVNFNSEFHVVTLSPNQQATVYLRIRDYAGNTEYISTDGFILDDQQPNDNEKPIVTVETPRNDIYNSDVTLKYNVLDPLVGDTFAGLKYVWYEVKSMGVTTQGSSEVGVSTNGYSSTLYSFGIENPTSDQLKQTWDGTITVNSQLNNSNEVEVTIWAIDNADNLGSQSISLKIDVTAPKITVSYDNNSGDTSFGNKTYFKDQRTATIVIEERNFDAASVDIRMTNSNGTVPSVAGWSTVAGTGNGDNTQHIARITYSADGDYTFSITFTDQAGNKDSGVSYGTSLAPTSFTIDRTAPVITVTYDNNDARNGNYYNKSRTATITIKEHNFETSRVKLSLTATDDGKSIAAPSISGWQNSGDTHTATIVYNTDGLYVFDIDYTDMAGNQAANYAGDKFYVDQTKPSLAISNIADQSANNSTGKIGFVITAEDTNFDVFNPVLTAVVYENGAFVTKTLDIGELEEIKNGAVYTVDNIKEDGIYRITCTVVDKAGNEFTEVLLEKEDGTTYTAQKDKSQVLVQFSVNREGSTYEIDENTRDLLGKYYVQNVLNDVVIVEINADDLTGYEVTLNGRKLEEGKDYQVEIEGGEGKWRHYTYIIDKSLFEAEDEYNIVVSSTDKAGSNAYNDVKGSELTFVVDRKKPVVLVSGLKSNGRYRVEKQLVTLLPTDAGGALQSLVVWLVDDEGNMIRELVNLSGEEFEKALQEGGGKITFEIEQGYQQNIRIICKDCAVDENGDVNTFDEIFTKVTVSTSRFMIFWANPKARYGAIGGVVAVLAAGSWIIIAAKKKKKEKEPAEAEV